MAMTDAEFAEQERRAGMAAAGIDVGAVDAVALCAEVRRLRTCIEELHARVNIWRENNAALAKQLADTKAELERRASVTFTGGEPRVHSGALIAVHSAVTGDVA